MTRWRYILRGLERVGYAGTCLVTALLVAGWIRSYFWRDDISRAWSISWVEQTTLATPATMARHEANAFWILSSGKGVIGAARAANEHVQAIKQPTGLPMEITWNHDVRPPSAPIPAEMPRPFHDLGFGYEFDRVPAWKHIFIGAGEQYWNKAWYLNISFPYWSLVVPLMLALTLRPARRLWIQRHRRSHGLCPVCAYDLRAHHPGDHCPECGTIIPPLKTPLPPQCA